MSKRSEKLVILKKYINLETGELYIDKLDYITALYKKACKIKRLNKKIARCKKCDEMNIKMFSDSSPGWGNLNADVFFVGQSLDEYGVYSGIPFILKSNISIDVALQLSGLNRRDVFISNVVHCYPPNNRATTNKEKKNCIGYLKRELDIVQPLMVIGLGTDAKVALDRVKKALPQTIKKVLNVKHPASFMYGSPEDKVGFIVKLSLEIDKTLEKYGDKNV